MVSSNNAPGATPGHEKSCAEQGLAALCSEAESAAGGSFLLASSLAHLGQSYAVVLLAAQPDPAQPTEYLLDATIVAEEPLAGALCLTAEWDSGRRTARVSRAGCARLQGIPAGVVQAIRAGDEQALLLRIEEAMKK